MPWTCPDCRRSFGRKNQSHGCMPSGTVDDFFAKRPALRPIYNAIERHLVKLEGVAIDPVTVCIMFKRTRTFAEVRLLRDRLRLFFLLSRTLDDPRIDKIFPLSARRTAHAIDLRAAKEVDREVKGWLTEAFASSPTT